MESSVVQLNNKFNIRRVCIHYKLQEQPPLIYDTGRDDVYVPCTRRDHKGLRRLYVIDVIDPVRPRQTGKVIGNAVVTEIVRKASGIVDRRMADIESEAVDKVGQVMVPFQRVLTDKMEEIESRIDGLVRTFDEKLDDKLESFLKLSEAEEELRPKHRIAGIGVFKPKIPLKDE